MKIKLSSWIYLNKFALNVLNDGMTDRARNYPSAQIRWFNRFKELGKIKVTGTYE